MEQVAQSMRETRRAMTGTLRYTAEGSECGTAHWQDVSRVGAALRLGRYLRPGRVVRLTFASPLANGTQETVTARVIWCSQLQDSPEFMAGVQVRREAPRAALAFSMLGEGRMPVSGRRRNGVRGGVWPHFVMKATEQQVQTAASVWQPI